jgi:two-component sensor histidine kinase
MSVQDDGADLPVGFEKMQEESLGLKLVHILSEQLSGKLYVSHKNPKEFKIVFCVA